MSKATLRPELQRIADSSVVKDLSHKLGVDVSKKAAEIAALVKTDIERAFIIMYGASILEAIAGTLIIRTYPEMEPSQVWNIVRAYGEAHKASSLELFASKRDGGEADEIPSELREMLGSMLKGLKVG